MADKNCVECVYSVLREHFISGRVEIVFYCSVAMHPEPEPDIGPLCRDMEYAEQCIAWEKGEQIVLNYLGVPRPMDSYAKLSEQQQRAVQSHLIQVGHVK